MSHLPTRHASSRALTALSTSALLVALAGTSALAQSPSAVPAASPTAVPSSIPGVIGKIDHPTGATDVVLSMESGGGFVRYGFFVTQAPSFVLYGDNTVIFRPGTDSTGTGFPPFIKATLSPEQVDALLTFAMGPGYLADAREHYQDMQISDAPTTVFRIHAGGLDKSVSVYALGMQDPSGPDSADIKALGGLGDLLSSFETQVERGQVLSAELYQPALYRAALMDSSADQAGVIAWPWADVTLDAFQPDPNNPSFRIGSLTPEQVALIATVPSGGSSGIEVQGPDGRPYTLALRPLLPGEPVVPVVQ